MRAHISAGWCPPHVIPRARPRKAGQRDVDADDKRVAVTYLLLDVVLGQGREAGRRRRSGSQGTAPPRPPRRATPPPAAKQSGFCHLVRILPRKWWRGTRAAGHAAPRGVARRHDATQRHATPPRPPNARRATPRHANTVRPLHHRELLYDLAGSSSSTDGGGATRHLVALRSRAPLFIFCRAAGFFTCVLLLRFRFSPAGGVPSRASRRFGTDQARRRRAAVACEYDEEA